MFKIIKLEFFFIFFFSKSKIISVDINFDFKKDSLVTPIFVIVEVFLF